jgi:hypothetical protein
VALKVFGRLAGGSAPVETSVFGVSASGWGEEAITWDNRPAPGTAALGTLGVGGAFESSYSVDVTDFVRREKAAGRETVTLLLRNTAASAAQTVWASRGSEYSDPRLIVNSFDPLPSLVPRVSQVFAASTAWSAGFRQALEDHGLGDSVFGYAVPDGAAQLGALPWGKIDQVSVRFTTNVSVVAENLAVRGVRVGSYAVTNFAYDTAQRVATWTLSPPIAARGGEKLLLDLDGDSPDGVSTFAGVPRFLDGEWANGSDSYASGDGGPGGDLRFQINVLPGDVDGNGQVAAGDMLAFRNRLLRGAADPFSGAATAYSPRFDLDGDGVIGSRDQASVRAALLTRLPAATPAAVARRSNAALVRIAPRRTQFMQQ